MTQPGAPSLKSTALGDLLHEVATTRRLLERLPDEHLGWKPHDRSFSLGELATHLANLLQWQVMIATQDELDLATLPARTEVPTSRDELLRRFDANQAEARRAIDSLEDAALGTPWTLKKAGQVLLQQPRLAILRGMVINHMIHHRGQLSVYLRLLNVPLPPMYGPTADEAF